MTNPHTPPTQAELDAWKRHECLTEVECDRLITEVERLRTERDGIANNISCGACAEAAFCGSVMYPHDETCIIARLTKKVEELRKDKEGLRTLCLRAHSVIDKLMGDSDLSNDESEEMKVCQKIAAMQQKGEE